MKSRRLLSVIAVVLVTTVSYPLALPQYSPWSAAVNLGAPINTPFAETGVSLSKQGLSLYFSSNRPCDAADGLTDVNLWVAHRTSVDAAWEEPECLLINADARVAGTPAYQDREPAMSRDQHWLYFASDRPGSLGPPVPTGGDIWVSWRQNIFDDQGWNEPVSLTGVNTVSREGTPHYFENDGGFPQLFFSTTRAGFFDIWVTDVVNGVAVGAAAPVVELNTVDLLEGGGALTHDGLEVFFFRGRAMVGIPFDLYSATRASVGAPWSSPVNLGASVNSAAVNDQEPEISPDRKTLFFASSRPGSVPGPTGAPSLDIWISTRTWGNAHK